MLTLNDGRNELWQWDTNRKLTVDADCSQVHFSNKVFGRSIDVDVIEGAATIPDVLLQTDKELTAWAFAGTAENGYTKIEKTFKVNRRNKPADYVFTPPEQTTLGELIERLDKIEEEQIPDAVKNAVEDYMEKNPVEAPVQSVNGKTGEVKLTSEDVGAISQDDLQEATNKALAQAKESGEFDGKDGQNGNDGKDGINGKDGKDGVSATHAWNGTVLTVTSASGTSTADLKGEKGDKGDTGPQGPQGEKGDKGDTGLAGSDASVTAANIADALGYTPANPEECMADSDPVGTGSLSLNRKADTTVGNYSVAVGYQTTASSLASHSEGDSTTASGHASHAEGRNTIAEGHHSHAEGNETKAIGYSSHAEGEATIADRNASHAEGYNTTAGEEASHAEGYETHAMGKASHAEGDSTKAYGEASHAEGHNTEASSYYSHAEGESTTASNAASHAEGIHTIASGAGSHAEGEGTFASGDNSHAEGYITIASKRGAHAEGWETKASSDYQHVQGKYNIEDANNIYAHIVGNGTSNTARSNAHTLDWNGNAWFAGTIKAGNTPYNDTVLRNSKLVSTETNPTNNGEIFWTYG